MEPEVTFWFYLGAVICFVLATVGRGWRGGRGGGAGVRTELSLVPLGLALFVFPALWTTGELAF